MRSVTSDWHLMISRIEVNDYGIASVWFKEQGLLLFAPTESVGDYRVVRFAPLLRRLQKRGFWWPDRLSDN